MMEIIGMATIAVVGAFLLYVLAMVILILCGSLCLWLHEQWFKIRWFGK